MHKIAATSTLSTILHILVHPIDTIKVRKIAKCRVHDVSLFQGNKVNELSTYRGFVKGYLGVMVGNLGFMTLLEHGLVPAVLAETTFRLFLDMNKISSQMGNARMDLSLTRKTLPSSFLFAFLRDLTHRGTFHHLNTSLLSYYKGWIHQDKSNRFHLAYLSAVVATALSHPFDVFFTKLASQRSMRYDGWRVVKMVVKEEGIGKMWSGFEWRLFYSLVGAVVMGYSYDGCVQVLNEAF